MIDESSKEKESSFRLLQRALYGDAIKDEKTAVELAEVLIRNSFGDVELTRQKPLSAKLEEDTWVVMGSLNKDETKLGAGPAIIKMNKTHATIESMYLKVVTPPGYLRRFPRDE